MCLSYLPIFYMYTQVIFCMSLQIGECVGIWWRPNFETILYPYCPPHITKPKVKGHEFAYIQLNSANLFLYFYSSLWLACSFYIHYLLQLSCHLTINFDAFSGNAGVQKAFYCSLVWQRVLCSAEKFQTSCCSIVWTVW